jgi:hypothetical protein
MDQDHNAFVPTAMVWDRNGELCADDFRRLLERLQRLEISPLNHEQTI